MVSFARWLPYLQNHPIRSKEEYVRLVATVRSVLQVLSCVTRECIVQTKDTKCHLLTVPLVSTAGLARNLLDRTTIQPGMRVPKGDTARKEVRISRCALLENFPIPQTIPRSKIASCVHWAVIVQATGTQILPDYATLVSIVLRVSLGQIRRLSSVQWDISARRGQSRGKCVQQASIRTKNNKYHARYAMIEKLRIIERNNCPLFQSIVLTFILFFNSDLSGRLLLRRPIRPCDSL